MQPETGIVGPHKADTHPLVILQQLIEKGADPAALSKMMDLAERYEQMRAQKEFSTALVAAQVEMPVIVKDTQNNRTNKNYAALETVQKAIRPIYTKHGFSISWGQGNSPREGYTRVLATLYHVGGFSKEFQGDYPLDGVGAKGGAVMNPLQGTVSSHTYAQRDMTRLMFNLTIADTDNDGEHIDPLLTPDQVKVVNELLMDLELAGVTINKPKLWEFLLGRKVTPDDGLHCVTQSAFTKAVDFLGRKRRETKK